MSSYLLVKLSEGHIANREILEMYVFIGGANSRENNTGKSG